MTTFLFFIILSDMRLHVCWCVCRGETHFARIDHTHTDAICHVEPQPVPVFHTLTHNNQHGRKMSELFLKHRCGWISKHVWKHDFLSAHILIQLYLKSFCLLFSLYNLLLNLNCLTCKSGFCRINTVYLDSDKMLFIWQKKTTWKTDLTVKKTKAQLCSEAAT